MNKYSKLLLVFGLVGALSIALLASSALAQGATPNRQSYGAGCYDMGAGMMHGAGRGMMGQGMMRGAGYGMMGMGMMRGQGQGTQHYGMMGGAWSAGTAITGTVPFGCPMAGAWGVAGAAGTPTAAITGDPVDIGKAAYTKYGCASCHGVPGGAGVVGPNLGGVATRAKTRVAGQSAEEYIRTSIVNPLAYLAPDCASGPCQPVMPQNFQRQMAPKELDGLVQYLLTLQ